MKAEVHNSAGFTLVEAMVALVILSLSLTGLFGLINTDLISLRRAEAVVASQNTLREAIRQVQLVRLSDGASGRFELNGYECAWQARLVEPIRSGRGMMGRVGLYDHGLYAVDMSLFSDARPLGTWTVRVAQYKQARELVFE